MKIKIPAYAILDGGGVKGAALVGALKAAEQYFEFRGYGGTSAGSIVALLSYIGYTPDELEEEFIKLDFRQFFDDKGLLIDNFESLIKYLSKARFYNPSTWFKLRQLINLTRTVSNSYGIYNGNEVRKFILEKIRYKRADLRNNIDVTFDDLMGFDPKKGLQQTDRFLKIVASDLRLKKAVVFSGTRRNDEIGGSVISAVRASTGYPFVFQPVSSDINFWVDGGLSSNLPVFLFENERKTHRYPVLAFDLVPSIDGNTTDRSMENFLGDLIDTALESSDHIARELLDEVHHIKIKVPSHIKTFSLNLSRSDKEALFTSGYASTMKYVSEVFPQHLYYGEQATAIKEIQKIYAPEQLVDTILRVILQLLKETSENITVSVLLPSKMNTLLSVYSVGEETNDKGLDLSLNSGFIKETWLNKKIQIQDVSIFREKKEEYGLSDMDLRKIGNKMAILSLPIFDLKRTQNKGGKIDGPILGVLFITNSKLLEDSSWEKSKGTLDKNIEGLKNWADILSNLLTSGVR